MKNPRCTKNQKVRKEIDEMLKSAKPGSIFFTDEISKALSIRKRSVTNRNVAMALRERIDVKLKEGCALTWVKI